MEKFEITGDKFLELQSTLNNECIEYLKKVTEEFDGRVNLVNEDYEYAGNEFVSCTYDGGNHPEYATNAFSNVYAVCSYPDGSLYLITEDTDEYPIDSITTLELYCICKYISDYKEILKGEDYLGY